TVWTLGPQFPIPVGPELSVLIYITSPNSQSIAQLSPQSLALSGPNSIALGTQLVSPGPRVQLSLGLFLPLFSGVGSNHFDPYLYENVCTTC
uniref:Uncharacterized protein n=1 Tax=Oncorhynchus mykiss TaxID=8022 RepID=A0A8C7SQE3_ONCMY